jgi:Protein of unknown function (DUF3618)
MAEDTHTLRLDVEQARSQLAQTVEALAHKATGPRRAVRRFGRPSLGLVVLGLAVGAVVVLRAARR